MSYATVGACPKCGAPVYAPSTWGGILPPPSTPSCACRFATGQVTFEPNPIPPNAPGALPPGCVPLKPVGEDEVRRIVRDEMEKLARSVLGDEKYDNSPCQASDAELIDSHVAGLKRELSFTHAAATLASFQRDGLAKRVVDLEALLRCVETNLSKGMSKSIQKLQARTISETLSGKEGG